MLSTIRPLTKQRTYIHFQHFCLSNSILTTRTIIQQVTRSSNIYFPGRGIIRSFDGFKISKNEDDEFQVPIDNKCVSTDNEIKFDNEIFQNKIDTNITTVEKSENGNKLNNLNKNITDILEELARKERTAGDIYRERAYIAAIKSIKEYPKKIESGKEARKLKFIGPSIEKKIDEILETGTCSYITGDPDSAERQLFNELIKIPRIGYNETKKRVNALKYMSKGYKSLEELSNEPDLQPDQKYTIEHIRELDEKIPRWEMDALQKYIFRTLNQSNDRFLVEACGSFRRGAGSSGSLIIVISHPEFKVKNSTENFDNFLKKFVDYLKIKEFCIDYFPKGLYKYIAFCRIPPSNPGAKPRLRRKIELRAVPYENYWLTVLAKTGDEVFYKSLQKRALEKGFQLSDTILAPIDSNNNKVGKPLIVNSENDIFKILDTRYLAPKDRDWK